MIISKPFFHEVSIRRHRKRNFTRVHVRSECPVEIVEIDEADAPVAFEAPDFKHHHRFDNPAGIRLEYRYWGGSFWAPVLERSHDGQPARYRTTAEMVEHFVRLREPHRGIVSLDEIDIVEVVDSNAETMILDEQASALRYAIIGEAPFERLGELLYTPSANRYESYTSPGLGTAGDREDNRDRLWRLDRFDAMIETIALERGEPLSEHELARFEMFRADVKRPDLLSFDDEIAALRYASKQVIDGLSLDDFKDGDVAFFTAYAGLRDALAPGAEFDGDRVVELLEGLAPSRQPGEVTYRSYREDTIGWATQRWQRYRGGLDNEDAVALSL